MTQEQSPIHVVNNDFDPALLQEFMEWVKNGRRLLKGHWIIRAWENLEHQLDGLSKPIWERDFGDDLDLPGLLLATHFPNGIVDTGIHHVLDRFSDVDGPTVTLAPWHAFLIDASGFTGLSDSDTMASHSGWTELTSYSEAVRQALTFGSAATRSISDTVSFSINATVTIQGLGVSSDNTKGGSSGTLFSTAEFTSPPSLVSGNTLTANYSLSD